MLDHAGALEACKLVMAYCRVCYSLPHKDKVLDHTAELCLGIDGNCSIRNQMEDRDMYRMDARRGEKLAQSVAEDLAHKVLYETSAVTPLSSPRCLDLRNSPVSRSAQPFF